MFLHILTITDRIITYKLLIVKKYNIIPKDIPKNKYNLISPLLKNIIPKEIIAPLIIKKNKSSKKVIISEVLKHFLNTLKISNKTPIIPPNITNIIKACSCEKLLILSLPI